MNPQTKQLVEAVEAYIKCGDMSIGLYNAYVNLCNAFEAYEQSTEQPEPISRHQENGNTTNGEKYILDNYGERWADKYETWASGDVIDALNDFASQQTADKDQKITELTNLLSDTNKRIQEIQDEEELKDKQLQVQQSHIDDQDQLIFEQGKEIKELKAEVERLEVIKWINVEERLPECDGIFLVCTIAGDVDMIEFNNGAFGVEHQNIFIPARQGLITHWQPLPQPTK